MTPSEIYAMSLFLGGVLGAIVGLIIGGYIVHGRATIRYLNTIRYLKTIPKRLFIGTSMIGYSVFIALFDDSEEVERESAFWWRDNL